MRTFVKCDKQGNIVATCRLASLMEGMEHPYTDLEEGESVIEFTPDQISPEVSCAEIHTKYRVDTGRKKLVPQQQHGGKESKQSGTKKKS